MRLELAVARQKVLELVDQHGQSLSPRDVVEAARPLNSPLHDYFTWDDGVAAEKYRLFEAGVLIRKIRIEIVREGGNPEDTIVVRALVSSPELRTAGSRSYLPIKRVVKERAHLSQVLAEAQRELMAIRRRYEVYGELSRLWNVIDAEIERLGEGAEDEGEGENGAAV